MPADSNLVLLKEVDLAATSVVSPPAAPGPAYADLGSGGTPATHPLVVRVFYSSAAAAAPMSITVETAPPSAPGSNTPGTFVQTAAGTLPVVNTSTTEGRRESSVPFITRNRFIRVTTIGAAVTSATITVEAATRRNPEMGT
jgi:hypothetical protein